MHDEQAVALLQELVRLQSVNGDEGLVADVLQKTLEGAGIACEQVEYAPGRRQLIATMGEAGGKTLGLSGHMDVVPVGERPWLHPPFDAAEVDGCIFGRGSTDMKGGLTALVAAMVRIQQGDWKLPGCIRLLATVGEETSAIGAQQLTELGYADGLDALLIGEPTSNGVVVAHKGVLWVELTTLGKTAHGSMPQAGINAVEHMVKLLSRILADIDLSEHTDDKLGASTMSINVLHGGNGTNVIPDRCTAQIDMRTIPGQVHADILARIQNCIDTLKTEIPDLQAELTILNDLPPVQTDVNDPFVAMAQDSIERVTGERKQPGTMSGYTDAARFVQAKDSYPIVICGPGQLGMSHQPDEYIHIDSFLQGIQVYETLIRDFFRG